MRDDAELELVARVRRPQKVSADSIFACQARFKHLQELQEILDRMYREAEVALCAAVLREASEKASSWKRNLREQHKRGELPTWVRTHPAFAHVWKAEADSTEARDETHASH